MILKKGLEHFFARDFPEASAVFNKVLKTNAKDQTAPLIPQQSEQIHDRRRAERLDGSGSDDF